MLVATVITSALIWREQQSTARALERAEQSLAIYAQGMDATIKASQAVVMRAMESASFRTKDKLDPVDQSFFELALKYYESVDKAAGIDPKYRDIQGKANFGIAVARQFLDLPGAEDAYRRSVAIYEEP